MTDDDLLARLARVLNSQKLAVLATHAQGGSYCSLVGFSAFEDLRGLVFATSRSTRKFRNILDEPNVAMMIDTRSDMHGDFSKAIAVTALGEARELPAADRDQALRLHLGRHASLSELLGQPDCALLSVRVRKYVIVCGIHDVRELIP